MTDHSAILQFVKDPATDCNPGALFEAHGECISTASAVFQTELRAEPHREEDARLYTMADIRALGGDHLSALVLGQLRFWWPRKLSKHRGVKKSYADWKKELCLSKDHIQRINEVLVKAGMVEIYFGPWGHFKSESTFYVLTAKAFAIKPQAGKSPMLDSIAQAGNPPMVQKAQAGNPPITENTKDTEKTEKPNLTSVPTKPGPTSTPELHQAKAGKADGKLTPPPVETKPAEPDQDLLPEKFLKIALKWKKCYEDSYKIAFIMPTEKTLKNFKDAMYGKVMKQAGIDPNEFVELLFSHTAYFTHVYGLNSHPDMNQVVMNINPLVAKFFEVKKIIESKAKLAAKIAKYQAEEAAKPPKVEHVHVPATKEEIDAIMAELEAGNAAGIPPEPTAWDKVGEKYAATMKALKAPQPEQPATVPVPVELEAHPVVISTGTASLETGCPVIEYAVLPLVPEVLPSYEEAHAWWLESVAKKAAADAEAKKKAKHYHA